MSDRALRRDWTPGEFQFQVFARTPNGGTINIVFDKPSAIVTRLMLIVMNLDTTTESAIEELIAFRGEVELADIIYKIKGIGNGDALLGPTQ